MSSDKVAQKKPGEASSSTLKNLLSGFAERLNNKTRLKPGPTGIVWYSLVLAALFSFALLSLVSWAPYQKLNTPSESLPESQVVVMTLLTVFVAGGMGGTLCNLRGVFKHYYKGQGRFPKSLIVPFFVRPWTGCIVGLFTFFLASFFNEALTDASQMTWGTFAGRLPFIGLAMLAGFGAQEFVERLKDIATTTFGGDTTDPDIDEPEDSYSQDELVERIFLHGTPEERQELIKLGQLIRDYPEQN